MIISFCGAGGTGKTTLLEECKKIYKDKFEYVDEVTRLVRREYNVEINETAGDRTQLLILSQHINNHLKNRTKPVIMDRCIIDGVIYTYHLNNIGKISTWIREYATQLYANIIKDRLDIVFYTPIEFNLVDDGERSTDKKFQRTIDDLFSDWFADGRVICPNTQIVRLSGSVKDRMKIIKSTIRI